MKIVFVHQNFPGQFGRLAAIFAAEGHEVVALGTCRNELGPGRRLLSAIRPRAGPDAREYQGRFAPVITPVQRAYGARRPGAAARPTAGFAPDLVVVNVGWGEGLFLKDIWPKARHVAYFEYFYAAEGQDVGFDPEFPVRNEETIWRLRLKNALLLAALYSCRRRGVADRVPARHLPGLSAGPHRGHSRRHRHAGTAAGPSGRAADRRRRAARRARHVRSSPT